MDETYARILRDIKKPDQEHAHRLMQCLVVAARPLRVKELAEILAIDFNAEGFPGLNPDWRWQDKEKAVMSACSSLVMIVGDGNSRVVQFSHYSVQEYLTASRLAEPIRDISRYHIRYKAAHTILAQACLGTLLRLDDRVDRDSIVTFPLAQYAAQCWPMHTRCMDAASRIKNGVERLFDAARPHFATWLWIYVDEEGRSMPTMWPEKPETTPLYYAAMFGFHDLAEYLITEHPEHVHARGGREETPMHAAAREGHVDILSLLLERGADVGGHRSVDGLTPLHRALRFGKLKAGQFLLDHGADINARDSHEQTPLFSAITDGNIQVVQFLLEQGADLSDRDDLVRMLLKDGPDVDAGTIRSSTEPTPLDVPAREDAEILRVLLEVGPDVGVEGATLLHLVVDNGRVEVVRVLIEHGADINVGTNRGSTPSHVAARGSVEIVRVLLKHGATVDAEDNEGQIGRAHV